MKGIVHVEYDSFRDYWYVSSDYTRPTGIIYRTSTRSDAVKEAKNRIKKRTTLIYPEVELRIHNKDGSLSQQHTYKGD